MKLPIHTHNLSCMCISVAPLVVLVLWFYSLPMLRHYVLGAVSSWWCGRMRTVGWAKEPCSLERQSDGIKGKYYHIINFNKGTPSIHECVHKHTNWKHKTQSGDRACKGNVNGCGHIVHGLSLWGAVDTVVIQEQDHNVNSHRISLKHGNFMLYLHILTRRFVFQKKATTIYSQQVLIVFRYYTIFTRNT